MIYQNECLIRHSSRYVAKCYVKRIVSYLLLPNWNQSTIYNSLEKTGGMIASGSNDETIHVYNANTGRDVGSLMSHGGSVTSLQFHGAKYLVSGSEDNNVVIWRTKPKWEVLKTLRGHKGPVESVAVHPSGMTRNDFSLYLASTFKFAFPLFIMCSLLFTLLRKDRAFNW